jgi:hypothetical protein
MSAPSVLTSAAVPDVSMFDMGDISHDAAPLSGDIERYVG